MSMQQTASENPLITLQLFIYGVALGLDRQVAMDCAHIVSQESYKEALSNTLSFNPTAEQLRDIYEAVVNGTNWSW